MNYDTTFNDKQFLIYEYIDGILKSFTAVFDIQNIPSLNL